MQNQVNKWTAKGLRGRQGFMKLVLGLKASGNLDLSGYIASASKSTCKPKTTLVDLFVQKEFIDLIWTSIYFEK